MNSQGKLTHAGLPLLVQKGIFSSASPGVIIGGVGKETII
jgi:hypothetical protein